MPNKTAEYEIELEIPERQDPGALIRIMEEAVADAFDRLGINYAMVYVTPKEGK